MPSFFLNVFNAHSKNIFQYDITTSEIVMDEVAKSLDINPNRFGLLATLLGNHILTSKDLKDFHAQLAPELKDPKFKASTKCLKIEKVS